MATVLQSQDTINHQSHVDYQYVDTASNGPRNRNRVMPLDQFGPPRDAVDCYTTYLRFTEALLEYAEVTPSRTTGRPPSVAGYPGPAYATYLPGDFDWQDDPLQAVREA